MSNLRDKRMQRYRRQARIGEDRPSKGGVGRPALVDSYHRWLVVHYLWLRTRKRWGVSHVIATTWKVSGKTVEKYVARHKSDEEVQHLLAVLLEGSLASAETVLRQYSSAFVLMNTEPLTPAEIKEDERLDGLQKNRSTESG